jgi:hypothetical protein
MSFIVKQNKESGHEVELRQDGEDVDILIDNELVMTIAEDGCLVRYSCSDDLGLMRDDEGRIQDVDRVE